MRFGCRRGGRGSRQVVRYPRVNLDRVCVTYSELCHVQLPQPNLALLSSLDTVLCSVFSHWDC